MKYEIGQTYYMNKGPGKPYKVHIVGIVDDHYIVYKWYGRHKQWWHYEVDKDTVFQILVERYQEML